MRTPDEDSGEAGPRPSLLPCQANNGPAPVSLAAWHHGGWCHHLPPTQSSLSTQTKPGSTVRIMFFKFSSASKTLYNLCFWGTSWSTGLDWTTTYHPGSSTASPAEHTMWGHETLSQTWWSAVWAWFFLSSVLYTADFMYISDNYHL